MRTSCAVAMALTATLASTLSIAASDKHNWITGSVVEISATERPSAGVAYLYTIQAGTREFVIRLQAVRTANGPAGAHGPVAPRINVGEEITFAPEGTQAWILSEDMEYQCRVLRQRLLKTSATGTPRVPPQESKPPTQDEKTGGGSSTPGNSGEQRPAIETPPAPLATPTSISAGDPAHNAGTARNSTATTTTSMKVAASPGVKAPALLYKVQPEYAEEARKAGLQGAVILSVDVGTDGFARNVKVVRSLGMGLDEKAIEAVQKWKFRPGSKDGNPVIVAATIQVNFRLPRDPASSSPSSSRDSAANPAMQKGSASYLQQRLHLWELKDAKAELGRVVGRSKNAESETFTFADPTKSYRVFDLTFDTQTRKLVEIRVYPWGGLRWDECKALWGSNYSQSTTEEPGVLVYSYLTRPITALVRSSGEVVSFDFR